MPAGTRFVTQLKCLVEESGESGNRKRKPRAINERNVWNIALHISQKMTIITLYLNELNTLVIKPQRMFMNLHSIIFFYLFIFSHLCLGINPKPSVWTFF